MSIHDTYNLELNKPRKNSLMDPGAGLSATDRKIAMLRVSGATIDTIAHLMGTQATYVSSVLNKPKVANYVLILTAFTGQGLEEGIANLNEAIDAAATEAFDVELKNMRELNQLGDVYEDMPRERIKAKIAASTIAQDILDRAGKRAPTRVINANLSGKIPEPVLDRLTSVLDELRPGPTDVTPSAAPAHPSPGRAAPADLIPFPATPTSRPTSPRPDVPSPHKEVRDESSDPS